MSLSKNRVLILGFAAIFIILIGAVWFTAIYFINSQTSTVLMVIESEEDSYILVKDFLLERGYRVEIIYSTQELLQRPLAGYALIWDSLLLNGHLTADVLETYIEGGGKLILTGETPFFIANTTTSDMSLHTIEHWFGAGKYNNETGGIAYVTEAQPFGTSLLNGDEVFFDSTNSSTSILLLSSDAQVISRWENGNVFAFYHSYGTGRVYYQAHLSLAPDNLDAYPTIQQNCEDLLKGALLWSLS